MSKLKITNSNPGTSKMEYTKSIFWLIEAAFRGFVGYVLLAKLGRNYVYEAAAIYSLGTAGFIVITHFVKAHR